jgi:hypothetical protein
MYVRSARVELAFHLACSYKVCFIARHRLFINYLQYQMKSDESGEVEV